MREILDKNIDQRVIDRKNEKKLREGLREYGFIAINVQGDDLFVGGHYSDPHRFQRRFLKLARFITDETLLSKLSPLVDLPPS